MSKRAIVGTAGHVDHGKTRLVEALTGIDCDRWAEEKERGITIDLGFAFLRRNDLQLGFVDVPGHERFVHNALAGLGGIAVVLLVVAADEGVKPQTREHLEVCSLLEIPAAVVALTKCDLAGEELQQIARLEVEELLAGTPFAEARIVAVSSLTGQGIEELDGRLVELARRHATEVDPERPARLPIDRAFHLKGLGVVVTGTLVSGVIAVGDTLEVTVGGARARVRSIQVHGESRPEARAGERTALQLTGLGLPQLERGHQLAAPESYGASVSLLVDLRLLPSAPKPLAGAVPIRLHLYASEVDGRLRPLAGELRPGESGVAEVRLSRPVTAVRGDRFVVRRPSPVTTLGGGRVLDPVWRRRRRARALGSALEALAGDEARALKQWAADAGAAGLATADAARRLGVTAEAAAARLGALAADQLLLGVPAGPGHGQRWLVPEAYRRLAERARSVVGDFFRRDRLARGMPKAEAIERIFPGRAAELSGVYLEWLSAQQVISVDGDRVSLPGRRARLSGEESRLAAALVARYEAAGLEPPAPSEVARELNAKPQIVAGVTRYLVERRQLARLPGGLLIAAAALDRLRDDLRASGWERFTVGDFKDRFALTRKWAIPLLEHLDSIGVTRRLGNERLVARPRE